MTYTPYNAPLLSGLLGDREIAGFFSVKAEIDAIVQFEIALAAAQADSGVIPAKAALVIEETLLKFEADVAGLSVATATDGTIGPGLIGQIRAQLPENAARYLHFGSTSQDLTDTSAMLRLRDCVSVLTGRLDAVLDGLAGHREQSGELPVMARTRMQHARPFQLSHKIDNWTGPLESLLDECPKRFPLQLGGPVGLLNQMEGGGVEGRGLQVAVEVATQLDLTCPSRHWHADRLAMVDIANWLSAVSGALGKMGQDIALMAQYEVGEVTLEGGGGSSAMPDKNNPVKAEALVTLARFNATLVAGMHHSMLHENERSGTAWMLEWMLMPQLAVATGAALNNANALLGSIRFHAVAPHSPRVAH